MLLLFLVTVSSARLPVVKRNASPHLKWAKKAGDAKMKVIVMVNKMNAFIFFGAFVTAWPLPVVAKSRFTLSRRHGY